MGWRSTGAELRSSRGGQPGGLPARVGWGPGHHVQGLALVAAALRGMRGRGAGRPCVWKLAPQDPPFNLIQLIFE